MEVPITKTLIGSYISHDEFVLVPDVLKEHNSKKEVQRNANNRKICCSQKNDFTNNNVNWIYIVLYAESLQAVIVMLL